MPKTNWPNTLAETFSNLRHPSAVSQLERIHPGASESLQRGIFAYVRITLLAPGGRGVMAFFFQKGANKLLC